MYVGGANSAPDSLSPRRLATVISRMHSRQIGTVHLVVEADGRADRQDTAGDAHGDGEDVVDEQRRPGDERRDRAEVLLADTM